MLVNLKKDKDNLRQIKTMKKSVSFLVLPLTGILFSNVVFASFFPNKSEYFYELNGGSDIYLPPLSRTEHLIIGAEINASDILNCRGFNPTVSILNSFKGIKEKIAGVPSALVDNLKGTALGYPMYKLQQSMPGLYNILQNTAFSAQNEFEFKVSDCMQVKRSLEEGNSPLSSILGVSDSQGWIEAATRAASNNKNDSVDISETSKTIAEKSEEYGIPWVHRKNGNSGGKSQEPIKVISDVVIAGYNLLLDTKRAIDSKDVAPKELQKSTPFAQVWDKPEKASDWAVFVLGDINISHSKEKGKGLKDAKAGMGLTILLQSCPKQFSSKTCATNVASFLWQLVDRGIASSDANLQKISAGNVLITKDIISGISLLSREEQIITVSKLAEEIAIQNLMDQALMLKRILYAGFGLQEVQNLKSAKDMVSQAIAKLDNEVKGLSFEQEMRKKMMTDTLKVIMNARERNLARSKADNNNEQNLIKNGAVYSNKEGGNK